MNQLQKDIKTALAWCPYKNDNDRMTAERLNQYAEGDLDYYWKLEMHNIIKNAIQVERTAIGQSVLKQLLEQVGGDLKNEE